MAENLLGGEFLLVLRLFLLGHLPWVFQQLRHLQELLIIFTVVKALVALATRVCSQRFINIYIISIVFGICDSSTAQNERHYFSSFEIRSIGLSQIPFQYKIGVPSFKQDNFTLWHFLSVESNRSLAPAVGFGTGYMGRGSQIPHSLFVLGEFQLRYLSPLCRTFNSSLTHLSKIGLGYRFNPPFSLTLLMSFDSQWSFFTEFGFVYALNFKPKPTLRSQSRCPRF